MRIQRKKRKDGGNLSPSSSSPPFRFPSFQFLSLLSFPFLSVPGWFLELRKLWPPDPHPHPHHSRTIPAPHHSLTLEGEKGKREKEGKFWVSFPDKFPPRGGRGDSYGYGKEKKPKKKKKKVWGACQRQVCVIDDLIAERGKRVLPTGIRDKETRGTWVNLK